MLAEMIDGEGEIAILSATSTMANQNTWIQWMQEELKEPEYAKWIWWPSSMVTTSEKNVQ